MMRRLALVAAILALPAATVAQTPRLPCIAPEQAGALVTFALPSLVQGVAQRCRTELPPSSYLEANAPALADRWRPDAGYSWAQARAVIGSLFTQFLGQGLPPEMDQDLLRTMAEPMLGKLLAKRVSTGDCALVDSAARAIAPLSGRDVGRLAVVAVMAADHDDKGLAGVLHICRPPRAGTAPEAGRP